MFLELTSVNERTEPPQKKKINLNIHQVVMYEPYKSYKDSLKMTVNSKLTCVINGIKEEYICEETTDQIKEQINRLHKL